MFNTAVNVSLAAYPGMHFVDAMLAAKNEKPHEPLLGNLSVAHTQLCPQNRGILDVGLADNLVEAFPETQFRLHANVRVLPNRYVEDWSAFDEQSEYWQALARVSHRLKAPAYTAHAGLRKEANMATLFDNVRRAEDLFACKVGIEGHYPTKGDVFLVSSWDEYREVFESGLAYAVDLSHLHIVAKQSGVFDERFVKDLLANENCIEVHVSGNDGSKDEHRMLSKAPWWWGLLEHTNPAAVFFSEGQQHRHAAQ